MQINRWIKCLIIVVVTVIMSACGGGGDDNNVIVNPDVAKIVNWAKNGGTPPTADDYAAAGVILGTTHTADEINRYIQQYYDKYGTSGAFDSEAELNDIADELGVTLLDSDGDGIYDAFDSTPNGDAHTPVASINQVGGTVFTTETISLSATASDPDGDSLTYVWSLESRPEGSQSELQTPTRLTSSFVPDVAGEYTVGFQVFDGSNLSAKNTVTFLAVVQGECVDLDWKVIEEDTTFDQPCYITRHISVEQEAVLTIEPGTTVIFKEDIYNGLDVHGAINAIGTKEKPIVFTSQDKTDGAWAGIVIDRTHSLGGGISTQNEMEHVVIEYAKRGIQIGGIQNGDPQKQQLSIINSSINHSKEYGLWTSHNIDLAIENVTFTNNDFPIEIYSHTLHMLNNSNNHYVDNVHNFILVTADASYRIDSSQTWQKLSIPYVFSGYGPVVEHNATLTIDPGVTMQFSRNNDFKVYGILKAVGTKAEPIIFTALQEVIDSNNTWKGLHLENNEYYNHVQNHELQYVILEYSKKGFELQGSEKTNVKIIDTTFRHNSEAGFTLKGEDINLEFKRVVSTKNHFPGEVESYMLSILDVTSDFTGNIRDLLNIKRGVNDVEIKQDQTWNKQTVPVYVESITVSNSATLTIEKGTTVAMASSLSSYIVSTGTLVANGTADEPIKFIGVYMIGQDSYVESPWWGFLLGGTMELTHVHLQKAGGDFPGGAQTRGAIVLESGSILNVSNSIFSDSGLAAIYIHCGGGLTQSNNAFLNSGTLDIEYEDNCH